MGQWWRNVSTQTKPIPVGNGNVVAAKPQEAVEVVAETPALLRLKRLGHVIRTGRPQHPTQAAQPVGQEALRARANTEFAQRLSEHVTARGVDEARRAVAQMAAARLDTAAKEREAAAAARAEKPAAVAETIGEAVAAAATAAPEAAATESAAEAEAKDAPVKAGTAGKNTMGKGSKRRLVRASE